MPTYVYKFIDTGETIEIQQAFTDDALTEAPHPSDGRLRPVKKVFQPVGVTFKGGGFYKTDSRGSSSSSSGTSTSESSNTPSAPAGDATSTTATSSTSSSTASTTSTSSTASTAS